MALNAYAELLVDGELLDGDTSVNEMGGIDVSSDHIECFSVSWGSRLNNRTPSRRRRNKVNKQPITILKPIDKTTPLLYQAIATNQRIDCTLKIFGINSDTGETVHAFTLKLDQATLISLKSLSPNTLNADTALLPLTDQLELLAQTLTYTDEINGIEYEDR
jgi:type VI secretion system Hcp family effector